MPGLKKRRQAETRSPRGDVENPKGEGGPTEAAPASAAPSTSGHQSSILLAGTRTTIFRKVLRHLISDEDEDDSWGIFSILREIVAGLMIGLVVIFVIVFLDHLNVIHMEGAHKFRDTSYELLTDPEIIASIEESAELKLLTKVQYESIQKELWSLAQQKAEIEEKVDETKKMEAEKEKLASVKEEYERLIASDFLVTLQKFCDECTFKGSILCMGRVIALQSTDGIGTVEAKLKIMESSPQCKKE